MEEPCPICRKPVPHRASNPAHPFCSPRCRQVDLGKWLGEEYRMPDRPADGEPPTQEPPPPESTGER